MVLNPLLDTIYRLKFQNQNFHFADICLIMSKCLLNTLSTRNLLIVTNFCAANSVYEEFACIQISQCTYIAMTFKNKYVFDESSTIQTTLFRVWWCIDFLILTFLRQNSNFFNLMNIAYIRNKKF